MNDHISMQERAGHRLLQAGMVLFLLGLITGLFSGQLANPRMGLTSHLEGVMNGPFLIVLGLMWPRLRLGARALTAGFWMALYGTYVNWATTLYGAAAGAGEKMAPITGKGFTGTSFEEGVVAFGFISLTIAIIPLCLMVLWGLRGGPSVFFAPLKNE
jgi:hydroxylaminobenzene mutase